MATKVGEFPYKSQSHLENIRRTGSQTFLLVCRQLGWCSCFTMLEGRGDREVEAPSRAKLDDCVCVSCRVGACVNWRGLVRQRSHSLTGTRVSQAGVSPGLMWEEDERI